MPYTFLNIENALKRANEFIDVGKRNSALETLCDAVRAKKHRTWQRVHEEIMFKYLELAVDLRKSYIAKEGIFQYKLICQQTNIKSFEDVVRRYIDLAEEKAEWAKKRASSRTTDDVDDLDVVQTPEEILLSAVSSEDQQDRSERVKLIPWVRFLWEAYRQCLDILKNNVRTEALYHEIAHRAFQFCTKFNRKTEFRKLCDNLRTHMDYLRKTLAIAQPTHAQSHMVNLNNPESLAMHLETRLIQLESAVQIELWQEAYRATDDIKRYGLMNLNKKPPKPQLMANYYQKLALVFWKADCHLFHAAALFRLFHLTRELKKTITPEEVQKMASKLVIATLTIPIPPNRPDIDKLVDTEENTVETHQRNLASLLGLTTVLPTRSQLLKDLKRMGYLQHAYQPLQDLYRYLEVDFHPLAICERVQGVIEFIDSSDDCVDIRGYTDALKNIAVYRLLKGVSQVYQTIKYDRLSELCPFANNLYLETMVVEAARRNDLQVRIDHRRNCLHFGTELCASQSEEVMEGPHLQSMPSEQVRLQLVNTYSTLVKTRAMIEPEIVDYQRERLRVDMMVLYYTKKDVEHEAILARYNQIEERKKQLEILGVRMEQEERLRQEAKQRKLAEEESKRVMAEKENRERQLKDRESSEIQNLVAKQRTEEIGLKEDFEQAKKEQKELYMKQRRLERRIDHLERAKRIEEIPLLEKEYEKRRENDRKVWEECEQQRIQDIMAERELAKSLSQRLRKLKEEAEQFASKVNNRHQATHEARMVEFQSKLDNERAKRLEARRLKRLEERRVQWIKEKEKADEDRRRLREEEKRKTREAEEMKRAWEEDEKRRALEEDRRRQEEEAERRRRERERERERENWRAPAGGPRVQLPPPREPIPTRVPMGPPGPPMSRGYNTPRRGPDRSDLEDWRKRPSQGPGQTGAPEGPWRIQIDFNFIAKYQAATMIVTGVNPYDKIIEHLKDQGETCLSEGNPYSFFNLVKLNDPRYERLPISIRVLLEAAVRNCDNFSIKPSDVEKILDWRKSQRAPDNDIPFKPARVLLQDLTGVAVVVDFAGMRDAYDQLGGEASKINPLCQVDLVVDHSVQVDFAKTLLRLTRGGQMHKSINSNERSLSSGGRVPISSHDISSNLCDDCDALRYCQFARNLSHNHGVQLTSRKIINGDSGGIQTLSSVPKLDQHILAERLKLRYTTCPFHRELSLGAESLQKNQDFEFERNKERFSLFKWASKNMDNFRIIPPGSGICHQINLEYLAHVVYRNNLNLLYPDSLVGADSHTVMINGLGVLGYGCGGIECEAVMLGQTLSMPVPQVVGYKLIGQLEHYATSTDLVLTITKHLRSVGVVGKFVEFFGPGLTQLSIADRATIANMCPEYGATVAFFPVDEKAIKYLKQTGRSKEHVKYVELYLRATKMYRVDFNNPEEDPQFTEVLELDLSTVVPSVSGPKRPHDRVPFGEFKADFLSCLKEPVGFKGFGLSEDQLNRGPVKFEFEGQSYTLDHGSVVIAAITSCTNTSNPSVMLGAGLLAKKAVERGLTVKPYVKTSLSPGSGVVTYYLKNSGVLPYLEKLGFFVVGYGCQTCIGNSGPLEPPVMEAIKEGDLVAVGVLSGNRNFEGRVHPMTRANYLASPLIVVACAIAGKIIDFDHEPLGVGADGSEVFLRDIWPTKKEIEQVEQSHVIESLFREVYENIERGNDEWSSLDCPVGLHYPWKSDSNYLKKPFFFDHVTRDIDVSNISKISNARALLYLGDSISTDMISPAGAMSRTSPAYRYLTERGVKPKDINSYGSYRGNDAVMIRGTFANIRLHNKLLGSVQKPRTVYLPTNEELDVYDASVKYKESGAPLIVIAGKEYGCGSSRDWAAKGAVGLGIKAVIAESYERIHRSNLIGMSILPLQFIKNENADTLNLTGRETFTIDIGENLSPRQRATVFVTGGSIDQFEVEVRFDTEVEIEYYKHGGILHYMLRQVLQKKQQLIQLQQQYKYRPEDDEEEGF